MRLLPLLALLLVACVPTSPAPCASPTPRTCDAPADIHVDAVTDLESFRQQASAAACDLGVRCQDALAVLFCQPEYASLQAERLGGTAPFDLDVARACVSRLSSATTCDVLSLEWDCFQANAGFWDLVGHLAGTSCSGSCNFGLACVAGTCVVPSELGESCTAAQPCVAGLTCREGTCTRARAGESCDGVECEPGIQCRNVGSTSVPDLRCAPPAPCVSSFMHHVGCACAGDVECPSDVSVCSDGACVLRPFPGEACRHDGPACFASHCDGSVCVLADTGEVCSWDADCRAGLTCSVTNGGFLGSPTGLCGPVRAHGEPCGPGVPGRCDTGLVCDIVCV